MDGNQLIPPNLSNDEVIKICKIKVFPSEQNEYSEEEKKKPFVLIRHGFNEHNKLYSLLEYYSKKPKEDPIYLENVRLNKNYIDAPLHEIGY